MSLKGKEVLVIDDDPQYLLFMNNVLSSAGITVSQAKNFQSAVEALKESTPHLIITDINLNDEKTGLDVQRYIKETPGLSALPLFVITSDASKSTIFQSLALGASEYILKPVMAKELIQKLRRLFMDYESPEINFLNNEGQFKSEFAMAFENDFDIEIETDISLRAINELSCILQGPVKFPKESVVDFQNDLMDSMGGDGLGYRSIDNGRSIEAGTFSTRFSLIGIHEDTAKKIRAMRVTKK